MWLISPYLNRVRSGLMKDYLTWNVLDIWCGPALTADHMPEDKLYYGIEYNETQVKEWNEKYADKWYKFFHRDLNNDEFDLGDIEFDTVTMTALVEHIRNHDNLFHEINKYLKKWGRVVLTTPTWFGNYIVLNVFSKIWLTSPEAFEEHCVIYTPSYVRMLCRDFGFKTVSHTYFQIWCNQRVVLEKI